MNKITELLNKRSNAFIFSLVSGAAYFVLVLRLFAMYMANSWLIVAFFSPLIICGIALVLLKSILRWQEEENYRSIKMVFWIHAAVFVMALVFLADMIIR